MQLAISGYRHNCHGGGRSFENVRLQPPGKLTRLCGLPQFYRSLQTVSLRLQPKKWIIATLAICVIMTATEA